MITFRSKTKRINSRVEHIKSRINRVEHNKSLIQWKKKMKMKWKK